MNDQNKAILEYLKKNFRKNFTISVIFGLLTIFIIFGFIFLKLPWYLMVVSFFFTLVAVFFEYLIQLKKTGIAMGEYRKTHNIPNKTRIKEIKEKLKHE